MREVSDLFPKSASNVNYGPAKIKVLISNDHPIMRVGLRFAVQREQDMEVVGETSGAPETVRQFERLQPDVILLDLELPHHGGPDTVEAIRRVCPNVPLIVLSSYPIDTEEVLKRAPPGIMVFVLKSVPSQEIVAAVRSVVATRRGRPDSMPS